MNKSRMIIIEGPQGTGKTTLANYLRENIASSNLYRLSGQKEKTIAGKKKSEEMYRYLLQYIKQMETIPMDLIFDRTFFSEEVYARLGYKEYSFTDVYEKLLDLLESCHYEIYLIFLYLENTELYQKRLARDSHHNYQSFSIDSSLAQQNAYLNLAQELESRSFHVLKVPMDDFPTSYQLLKKTFQIK